MVEQWAFKQKKSRRFEKENLTGSYGGQHPTAPQRTLPRQGKRQKAKGKGQPQQQQWIEDERE